jgi:hypothetical protein
MLGALRLFADSNGGGAAIALLAFLVYAAIIVLYIAGLWKVFEKAGQKGWLAIIPILNLYILIRIAGREGWWIILFLIPCVNIIVAALVYLDVADRFGKSAAFGIGMWLLGFIFIPILGFGDARYQGDTTPIL